ncbi:MAG: ROK family protein [Solirubrobacteraceae bacterium]
MSDPLRGGIDLGGTKIQAAIVRPDGIAAGQHRVPTPTDGGPAGVGEAMAGALKEAAAAAGVQTRDLVGVGVGSPGVVDRARGTVSQARNLPGWEGTFALGPELTSALGCPVVLGNDVQVTVEGEYRLGAGRGFDSLLCVAWGTGVGGGIVIGGEPWRGRGAAGEIGHTVVKMGGRRCPCGRKGCLEAYAGRAAMEARARKLEAKGHDTDLFRLMERKGRTRLTSGVWAKALAHEDPVATKLVGKAVKALGAGIASAVNLLDVEAVVIAGGLGVRFGEPMRDRIEAAMMPHLFADSRPPAVKVAELGDLGGAVGASLLVGS